MMGYLLVKINMSMIGSLITSFRPDIMFAICACARFQVTLKVSHLQAVKRIFSDYAEASLDRKSTTGGCQFLGFRLISWQYKKLTVVATSSTKAEYVATTSCCAQASATIKKVKDAVQLCALINRKKVVVTEDVIRRDLHLDDDDGVECLPNKEIFAELARMGYEKPPPKLTFYKALFSAQWNFLILDDLTSHHTKYTSPTLTQKMFANMMRVGEGFSGVETLLFATMMVQPQAAEVEEEVKLPTAATLPSTTNEPSPLPQDPTPTPHATPHASPSSPPHAQPTDSSESSIPLLNTLLETCATLSQKVAGLNPLLILLWVIKRMQTGGGKIKAIDIDANITLVDVETQEEVANMDAELQERITQKDVSAATKEINVAEPTVFDDEDEIHSEGSRTYWNIIRVSGITKAYQIFEDMLKGFDREDLVSLWRLVKEKFSSTVPNVDKEKALWVELERLFKPDANDVLWKLQRVNNTFHVSNLKKCMSDETLVIPLDEIQIDNKIHFVEEPVKIMDREVKFLKQSRIPIVKV
nr:hypothetical protein [Tanacetum cinerariifolium]